MRQVQRIAKQVAQQEQRCWAPAMGVYVPPAPTSDRQVAGWLRSGYAPLKEGSELPGARYRRRRPPTPCAPSWAAL